MKYRLVIFDLDGTILNTLNDLAASVNEALRMNDMPMRSYDEVRRFVGNGVEKLIRRAVTSDADESAIMKTLKDFKAHYSVHSNDTTGPYEGIPELMRELHARGIKIAVHSNKYDAAVQDLCKLYYSGIYDCAIGEGENCPKKPDPTGALTLMQRCGMDREHTLYVGDSEVDLQTAKNAGIDVAWVSWGFRHENELGDLPRTYTLNCPNDLKEMMIGK